MDISFLWNLIVPMVCNILRQRIRYSVTLSQCWWKESSRNIIFCHLALCSKSTSCVIWFSLFKPYFPFQTINSLKARIRHEHYSWDLPSAVLSICIQTPIYWVLMILVIIHQLMVGLGHFKTIHFSLLGLALHQVPSDSTLRSLGDYLVNFPWTILMLSIALICISSDIMLLLWVWWVIICHYVVTLKDVVS